MNQRVLITGASHGIGKAAAERFAKEGCTLILNCRQSVEELSALESYLKKNYSVNCISLIGDVSSPDFVKEMFQKTAERFGGVDILINNAGISHIGLLHDGAGPCGPCSEIYYDRGEKYGCGSPDCKVGCECDRFMEVWNNVFTQFNGDGHGNYEELENKNIDTGMGLERLAVVVQDVDSVFDIDTMKAIRDRICEISHKTYQTDALDDVSIRIKS